MAPEGSIGEEAEAIEPLHRLDSSRPTESLDAVRMIGRDPHQAAVTPLGEPHVVLARIARGRRRGEGPEDPHAVAGLDAEQVPIDEKLRRPTRRPPIAAIAD